MVVVVRDSGVGLSAEELRTLRAGSLFEQVGRGKLQGNGGTGLGLSISREILNLHRGSTLEISSEGHGRGTSYEMALRLEEVAAPAPLDVQAEALLVPSLSARGGAAPPAARVGEPGGDGGGVDSAARAQFGAAAAEGQGDTEPSAAAASAAGAGAQPGAPPAAAPKPHFDDSFLCLHVEVRLAAAAPRARRRAREREASAPPPRRGWANELTARRVAAAPGAHAPPRCPRAARRTTRCCASPSSSECSASWASDSGWLRTARRLSGWSWRRGSRQR